MVLAEGLPRGCGQVTAELQVPEGLPGAGGAAAETARSHGRCISAGGWQDTSQS